MKWSEPADRRVVEAVIATFCESSESSHDRLSLFKDRDWVRSYHWLDASGMALYFLDELQTRGIEDAIPKTVLGRLQQNLADNTIRSSVMFAEFAEINRAFQQAGILYSNLKGFTLSPESCPNPALRCQLDLDFLVDGDHLNLCREILAKTGYKLTASTETVWEFKAGSSELMSIKDHYKVTPQRSVELHFAASPSNHLPTRDERLDRLRLHSFGDIAFPALSVGDLFVGQALHLFGHVRSACTRLSWFLEYKHHVLSRYDDSEFWSEVQECSQTQQFASIGIGVVTLLSARLFSARAPEQLESWTVERLPAAVRLWIDHYGRRSVLADFPGTKLYLLLEDELARGDSSWKKKKRSRLLPLRRVPVIVHAGPDDNIVKWFRRGFYQSRYILFRLRFHVVEGLQYMIESARWNRQMNVLRDRSSYQGVKDPSPSKSLRS